MMSHFSCNSAIPPSIVWYAAVMITGELYTEAADEAMAAMKGRLANQYYTKAEEAWAEVEEEE